LSCHYVTILATRKRNSWNLKGVKKLVYSSSLPEVSREAEPANHGLKGERSQMQKEIYERIQRKKKKECGVWRTWRVRLRSVRSPGLRVYLSDIGNSNSGCDIQTIQRRETPFIVLLSLHECPPVFINANNAYLVASLQVNLISPVFGGHEPMFHRCSSGESSLTGK